MVLKREENSIEKQSVDIRGSAGERKHPERSNRNDLLVYSFSRENLMSLLKAVNRVRTLKVNDPKQELATWRRYFLPPIA